MTEYHIPVLLQETIAHLKVKKNSLYVDCTLGDGGHSLEILKLGGRLIAIDYDPYSIERSKNRFVNYFGESILNRVIFVNDNFKNLDLILSNLGVNIIHGILFDLGYSMTQVKSDEIGMSFLEDSPLDMRLDKSLNVTASDLINVLPEKLLANLFFKYGDITNSKELARKIVQRRSLKKFQTTKELADFIVDEIFPGYLKRGARIHPATKVFQALRIAVNNEFENLEQALPKAVRFLKLPGSRMCVITFHSSEDRIVKSFGKTVRPKVKEVTSKPITPSSEEIKKNKSARSAKLRVYERTNE